MTGAGVRAALRRFWWQIAGCMLIAVAIAAWLVHNQVDEYVSQGSYVVRAEAVEVSDLVRAAETLAGSDELIRTYANLATSELIETGARDAIRRQGFDADGTRATSEVVAEANVLLIGAIGPDPDAARAMAIAVGELTEDFVSGLGDAFALEPLDAPSSPGEPRSRDWRSTVAIGLLGGLLVGSALAVAVDRVLPPRRRREIGHILDPASTAFTRAFLERRLQEELARVRASDETFSIGVLRVLRTVSFDPDALEPPDLREPVLAEVAVAIKKTLLGKDILGHMGHGCYVAILPLADVDEARVLVERWRRLATLVLFRRPRGGELVVLAGACEYTDGVFVGDDDAVVIASELHAHSLRGRR